MSEGLEGLAPPPLRTNMLEPSYTYDEVSMQHSHNFIMALQELKNLRPQLYSAAEICETSYLYSDQKQLALENLKDYSVKALVNAVDHLGTVAYKLNDLLTQQITEVSSAEVRVATLSQRLRSCQEHSDREGLKQQSLAKSTQINHKHYILPDAAAEVAKRAAEQDVVMLRETFDPEQVHPQVGAQSRTGPSSCRTLAWHFAVDQVPSKNGGRSTLQRPASTKYSPARVSDSSFSREDDGSFSSCSLQSTTLDRPKSAPRSKSTERSRSTEKSRPLDKSRTMERMHMSERSRSTERRPSSKMAAPIGKVASLDRGVSQLNAGEPDKEQEFRGGVSRSRSLLRSLLGRGRIGKQATSNGS